MDPVFVLTEAWKGLRRNGALMAAVVVSVAISLTLVGASWLLSLQVDDLKGYWYDKVEVSVFLCGPSSAESVCPSGSLTVAERDEVEEQLRSMPETEELFYESRDDAWERFSARYEGSAVLAQVDETSMPETFRVKLHDPTQFGVVAEQVAQLNGVESVQDQRKLLAKFFSVVSGLQAAALGVALAQVGIALLLVGNTVRVAVAARRREIAVMRLVGAPPSMIRGPFVVEAALAGLAGGLLACASLTVLWHLVVADVVASSANTVSALTWVDVMWTWPVLLAGGVGVPALAATFALRRHLRI